jgi:indole-3-glycerol phosphate synthase
MAEDILALLCRERAEDAARSRRDRPASSLEREAGPPRPCFARAAAPASAPAVDTRNSANRQKGGADIGISSIDTTQQPLLLIAECKKASPSRGLIVPDYDPVNLARAYERGGAGMVSVLTEPRRFLGADAHLSAVRAAVGLPVLRKDFAVDEYQVREAWAIGADAVLLIAAALERSGLSELAACARELGLSVLIEARDEVEVEAALELASGDPAFAVGVNSRDLRDFSVDRGRAAGLARLLAEAPFSVAESGLRKPEDAADLAAAGYRGFLVGEALSGARDPESATRGFAEALAAVAPASQAGSRAARGGRRP